MPLQGSCIRRDLDAMACSGGSWPLVRVCATVFFLLLLAQVQIQIGHSALFYIPVDQVVVDDLNMETCILFYFYLVTSVG